MERSADLGGGKSVPENSVSPVLKFMNFTFDLKFREIQHYSNFGWATFGMNSETSAVSRN